MRWAAAVLGLLIIASATAGQQTLSSDPSKSNPNDLCSIEGVVVKATTGEGLKKIAVNLMSMQGEHQSITSLTDTSGRFTFTGLEPGRYGLAAGGNGYPQQTFGYQRGRSGPKVLVLTPGTNEKSVIIRLTPPGVITGTVRDEEGDPVVGGQVQALRLVRNGERRQALPGGFAQTNDLGQYRIFGLEPGQYIVGANFQRQNPLNVPAQDVYLPTYHPSSPSADQAMSVEVSPGDEVSGIDVDLVPSRSVTVRGWVVTEFPARNLRGLYVSLTRRESFRGYMGGSYGGAVMDEAGNFEIRDVPPGSYILFANVNDNGHFYSGHTPVEAADANVDGVTVVVGSGLTLRGRVRLSPDSTLDLSRLGVSLRPDDNYMSGAGAQVAADGTFVLENISDGTYRINVGGFPEEFYLESARLGGSDVLTSGLTVSQSDAGGSFDLVLSADGGRVDGVVLRDQQPVSGAIVVLVPDPPNRKRDELYSFKTTDPLGRFSLLGLPPGEFKLFAWEQREGVTYNDPDFLKDYEDRGTPVHIEQKSQQSIQLPVIPAEDVQ